MTQTSASAVEPNGVGKGKMSTAQRIYWSKHLSPKARGEDQSYDITFSFAAGGWFQMYMYGTAHALMQSGVLDDLESQGLRIRFSGSSAGALTALCLVTKADMNAIREYARMCSNDFRASWFHLFRMKSYLVNSIHKFTSDLKDLATNMDMQNKLRECYEVFVTVLPLCERKVIWDFRSHDDVVEALVASCCLAPLVGVPFRLKETGQWVCDGGLRTIIPHKGEPRTVTVSPYYFNNTTIHPSIFIPIWWGIMPPSEAQYDNLFAVGYNDMIEFLVRDELLSEEKGESLLLPEVDFSEVHGWFHIVLGFVIVVMVRPFVAFFIYLELAVMSALYTIATLRTPSLQSFRAIYDNIRNMLSVRVFGRLFFSAKVPHNSERLTGSSQLYRVFEPLVLGGNRRTGRECTSPMGSPTGQGPHFSPTMRRASRTRPVEPSKAL